jgi:hypothetical protein
MLLLLPPSFHFTVSSGEVMIYVVFVAYPRCVFIGVFRVVGLDLSRAIVRADRQLVGNLPVGALNQSFPSRPRP